MTDAATEATSRRSLDAVPAELRERRQWLLWRNESGRKTPYRVSGRAASSTKSATWNTFDACASALAADPSFAGVGFVFTKDDPFVGIDLDDCRDADTGEISPWAQAIIDKLPTYAEVSPSGTGVKLWARGELPGSGSGKKSAYEGGAVELYQHSRYFAVTGRAIDGRDAVRNCSAEVSELWRQVFGASTTTTTETGDVGPDPESRATADDIADFVPRLLALPRAIEGSGGSDATIHAACEIRRAGIYGDAGRRLLDVFNEHRCDPPWSASELDHKWASAKRLQPWAGSEFDEIEGGEDTAGDRQAVDGDPPKRFTLDVMTWSDFQAADFPQRYLIPGLVVEGEHLIIGGRTKGLKTMISLDMMISLASGAPFLGHFPVAGPCPVAFVSGESGRATLQRAAKTMASTRKVVVSDDRFFIGFKLPRLSLADHLAAIEALVRSRGIKLLCIDPAYLATLTAGNADKASNQFAMGLILEPFGRIGAETGCTMALVHHARKTTRLDAYRPMTRDDLTQSGFDAWMRQWLLLSRRSPFRRGLHELHMEVGGSAGHSGEYHVAVDEGQPADPLVGRRWDVSVIPAEDGEADAVREREAEKAEKLSLDIAAVRSILLTGGNKGMSKSAIAVAAGFNATRNANVLAAMMLDGELEECQYVVSNQGPRDGGYRLAGAKDER